MTPSTNGQNGAGKAQLSLLNSTNNSANGGEPAEAPAKSSPAGKLSRVEAFDQPVVLQQTSLWSRAIVWGIVGVTSFVLIWASVAKIEEAIPATGKLEPQGAVQGVQAPIGGVVQEILVQDGQRVNQGDVLIRLDTTAAQAQQRSLLQIRTALEQENRFYRAQLSGMGTLSEAELIQLDIPAEIVSLAASRSALLAENQLYQTQLGGASGGALSASQQARLSAIRNEADSRTAAAQLEVSQLQEQLTQAQGQLSVARQTLAINQGIVADIAPAVEDGALARVQLLRQQTEVLNGQGEVERLSQEVARLRLAIDQAGERLQNTVATSSTDLLSRMADNEKRIAEIDSQLNKALVDNERQISEVNSQLSQAEVTLRYQELRAPVDGVVFDLQAKGTGFVASTTEPILKIVPADGLIATVDITNRDIGFVREGMEVDVRIDSFPFSEFGDVEGKLISIGSDALPPTEVLPFYHFPAKIEIDQQSLNVNGRDVPLQSGMSISANIKVRDRTVMSIFTDLFVRKVESLRTVR
jgi:hemolysin D